MKIHRLYIKIFLAFIGLLLVTQFLIFGLFRHVTQEPFRREISAYLDSTIGIVRELVEYKLREHPEALTREVVAMRTFITQLGTSFRSLIWIETAAGAIVYRSSPEAPPPALPRDLIDRGNYQYHISMHRGSNVYLRIRFSLPGSSTATVHFFHRRPRPFIHDIDFVFGLVGICILMALLLYPLTRYITRPLKRLTQSAHGIAAGDFDQVVEVSSNDEIGELAAAFNVMAVRISHMIRGTKELTANVSHELRSPLARMRVALELLDAKVRDTRAPDAGELIVSIESEIEEMDRLIDRILQLSKLDHQSAGDHHDTIDISLMLREVLDKYRPIIERRGLTVTAAIDDDPCLVCGNREELSTALNNLVDNAVKFSPDAGAIDVSLSRTGGAVVVAIANSADRIPEDDLEAMFKPFARLETSNRNGYGLGLAIVKKIVEKHGGVVRAGNTGRGICFEVVFNKPICR